FSVVIGLGQLSKEELILLDRLYRKYLRLDDLENTERMMLLARERLAKIPANISDLRRAEWAPGESILDPTCGSFADVFSKYFEGFHHCSESSRGFFEDWQVFKPVRTIVCDMPDYFVEKLRPLEEYDMLGPTDVPFWLR
ncbi:MAG: hypothetical protein ACRCWE_14935, partial [Stenotrophomonas maltophilia]